MPDIYGKDIYLLVSEHVLQGQGVLRDFSQNERVCQMPFPSPVPLGYIHGHLQEPV